MHAITIGLDIAKSVFQVRGEDGSGRVVVRKRLRRGQVAAFFAKLAPALVGIEACGTAHYWGRTLRALGHQVRLIPAAYVKPVCPAQQERCARRGGDLRRPGAAGHALCRNQERRAAGGARH